MEVMDLPSIEIECLACATTRLAASLEGRDTGVCPTCGYVGWALPAEIDDTKRHELRAARLYAGSQRRPI
jgi:hypothetical protein